MRDASHQDRSIVHLEAEDLVEISFAYLANGDALLGACNVDGNLLEFSNIECPIAFMQLFLLPLEPSSRSVVKVVMEFIMLRGCHGPTFVRRMITKG
jgi:hypothetical protein